MPNHKLRAFTMFSGVFFLVLASLGSTSCTGERLIPSESEGGAAAVISGSVVDLDGKPLPSIPIVTTDGMAYTTTDCKGRYDLAVPDDWSGIVEIDFAPDAYAPLYKRHTHAKDVVAETIEAPIRLIGEPDPCIGKPLSQPCRTDADCDDRKYCNGIETCDANLSCIRHSRVTCDDGIPCTVDVCDENIDQCRHLLNDEACDDRLFCTGAEVCTSSGCVSSGDPCAAGTNCDEGADTCTSTGSGTLIYVDDDGPQQPGYDPGEPFGSRNRPYLAIQEAVRVAKPGDTIVIRAGTYTSGSTSSSVPIVNIVAANSGQSGKPLTIRAADGERVLLDGRGITRTLVVINAGYVDLEGLELTGGQRVAVDIMGDAQTTQHVNVRRCFAHDNVGDPSFIGGAFRTLGPVQYVTFEECVSARNSNGFQFRENPTLDGSTSQVPPSDLPEAEWDTWPGYVQNGARYCTMRKCLAYDNRLIDEHSDGFGARYAIDCVFEDNIAFGNSDDGFDILGGTRCIIRRNIAFRANPMGTVNGDGNGIKIGVRGGLDNVVYSNIAFDNPRAGIDLADTERPKVYHNTAFQNGWFGIWSEATRSRQGGMVALNNLSAGNLKDSGVTDQRSVQLFDYNAVSDANNHNHAVPIGPHGMVSTDPRFLSTDVSIDLSALSTLPIAEQIEHIRNQVFQKFGLRPDSPAAGRGAVLTDVQIPSSGAAPDLGAVQSK